MANTSHGGHGGAGSASGRPMDPGAVGNGTTEWKEMRETSQKMLNASKWTDVKDDVGGNVNQNLINIVANTNRVAGNSNINVSNHLNAFNGQAHGTEVFYYLGDSRGYALARDLSAAISSALGTFNRGPKATTSLYVVNNTVGTTVLIEWCFVDNASDMAKWRANKDKAINAALKVLGVSGSVRPSTPTPTTPPPTNNGFNINNYHTTKPAQIKMLKADHAYREKELKNKVELCPKNGIYTVVGLEYSGKYPRYKLKSGLYVTTRKDTVVPHRSASTPKPSTGTPVEKWISKKGTFTITTGYGIGLLRGKGVYANPIAQMPKGSKIVYDQIYYDRNGYVWIRQPRSGHYGYMATGETKNGQRTSSWGTGA